MKIEGKIERFLSKNSVKNYCESLKFKTILKATLDFGRYESAELTRMLADPLGVERTLIPKQPVQDGTRVSSHQLLEKYRKGAIILGSSGYGKTTLSRSLVKQAIENRWRGQSAPIIIEAPLPDIELTRINFTSFLLQRVQAHQPEVSDASFCDVLRSVGATVICDSLDRTSAAFQKEVATMISLFLRDYPLSQVFVFSRADAKPIVAMPMLELESLSDAQMREMEKSILSNGSEQYYSIIGAVSPILRSICENPLILKLTLEHWQRHSGYPRDINIMFQSWLESVLDAEPDDLPSRVRRERALMVIAQATTECPLPQVKLIATLEAHQLDAAVLSELIRCDAVRVTGSAIELQHDALADYLRAKAIAELEPVEQLSALSRLINSPDSFLPVLLMAQLVDQGARDSLWRHMVSGSIETYFEALRYRRDVSEDLRSLGAEDLSRRYLTELLDGIDEPLEGFFPVLRPAINEWLTEERKKDLAIVGSATYDSLLYKIQAQQESSPRVQVDIPSSPGTIRYVRLDLSRYRTDSARLLGITLLGKGIKDVVEALDIEGGPMWTGERLIGRVRLLSKRFNFPISVDHDLIRIEQALQPYADQSCKEGTINGVSFSIQSMLDDIAKLRSVGISALDAWWSRLGWEDSLTPACVNDDVLASVLDEEYRRTQLIYKEIVEASFERFAGDMTFYPILPLRWTLRVQRKDASNHTFVIYPRWRPVKDWKDAGADVSFDGPWTDIIPHWEEIAGALFALGRPRNIPHYGGFTTHSGYDGTTLTGRYTGATPVTDEVISWLQLEVRRVFRNLPASDGLFAV